MTNPQQSSPTPEQALQKLILDEDLERLEDVLAEFNLFDVLGIARREVLHSAFLAWLLDPHGSHRLRDYFLRGFLSEAAVEARNRGIDSPTAFDVDGWEFSDIEIATERHNIDILLIGRSDEFVCLIENKINIGEHSNQLRRYLKIVEDEYASLMPFPIFLTPEGIEPQEEIDKTRYVPVDYQRVAALIDRALKTRGSIINSSVASFLEQYARTLRRHVLATPDNIQELAYKIYNNHREAMNLIIDAKESPPIGWEIIEPAMKPYAPRLQLESSTKRERRFFTPSLDDIPELNQGEGWNPSGRIVRFEFKYTGAMTFHLWIGPGPDETRRKLYDLAQESGAPFRKSQILARRWQSMYQKPILSKQDYELFDPDRARLKIEQAIADFFANDYRPLVDAIRQEFGLPPKP